MKFLPTICVALLLLPMLAEGAEAPMNPGDEVLVVYNSAMRDSKRVADHYAQARKVPAEQVVGFRMPEREVISRQEYREFIEEPLRKKIEKEKWIRYVPSVLPATTNRASMVIQRPIAAKIRYLVLCYGVPLRITHDGTINEPIPGTVRPELRRNEAAVDNELAILPRDPKSYYLTGIMNNPFLGQTNAAVLSATNGLLMVARLDGPTPAIAEGLVDKALVAEKEGLWGRMYFDVRNISDPNYAQGDTWINGAATIARQVGYETIVDTNSTTFPASFPMSQIAVYIGWYDGAVSGPFTLPKVEFMPGAFAYHLFSYSATSMRGKDWVPTLLAKGATCTVGYVDEPYLQGTINVNAFLGLWVMGFTFGEAAYAGMNVLSWQTTVVGDPLYCPFRLRAEDLHKRLTEEKNPMLEWSILRAINQNMLAGEPRAKIVAILEREPTVRTSAVLQEKLAELYLADNKLLDAADTYLSAYGLSRSPMQRQRIAFEAQRVLALFGRESKAIELLENVLKENPDYPDRLAVYTRLFELARRQGKDAEAAKYKVAVDRLTPPPPPPAKNSTAPAARKD